MIWILYVSMVILSWFLWNIIHEASHIIMAKALCNKIYEWSIKPYPHFVDGNFVFASSSYTWGDNPPSKKRKSYIHLAPRIADMAVIPLLAVSTFLIPPEQTFLLIFCAAGIIDLIVGSIGYSEHSDLQSVANTIGINPWTIRVPGLAVGILEMIAVVSLVIANGVLIN